MANSSETRTCRICGEEYVRAQGRELSTHFDSVHSDYVGWYRRYWKVFIISSAALIPFLVLGDYVAMIDNNFALLVLINILYAAFVSSNVIRYPLKLRYFKRQSTQERRPSSQML